MAWISTEAVRTQNRVLVLGDSLSDFMRSLGIYSSDGKAYTRLRNQMDRLFNASVRLIYEDEHGKRFVSSAIADRGEFWWNPKRPNERVLWDSKIRLGEDFFNEIVRHPVPLNMNTLTAMKRSPLGLDLYLWLVYRIFSLRRPDAALLADALSAVRSGPGQGQRQHYCSAFPHGLPTGVEEDQAGLAGPELHDGQRRPDPLALDSDDRSGGCVATAGPNSFHHREDDRFRWQSQKPTSRTQPRTHPRGQPGRCAGSSSRASRWTPPIRRARNASGPPTKELKSRDKGPLTRPGSPVIAPLNQGQLAS